jgi:hypothetical protein
MNDYILNGITCIGIVALVVAGIDGNDRAFLGIAMMTCLWALISDMIQS